MLTLKLVSKFQNYDEKKHTTETKPFDSPETCKRLSEEGMKTKKIADLSSAVCSLLNAETNKDGVCHFDQDVIYTVHVDELNPPPLHVIQNILVPQRSVKTPIPICKTNTDTHLYLQHESNHQHSLKS